MAAFTVPEWPERMTLSDFWNDDIPWHMRLLLLNTGTPGAWIASSPDMEVTRLNLMEHRVCLLQPSAPLPAVYAGYSSSICRLLQLLLLQPC